MKLLTCKECKTIFKNKRIETIEITENNNFTKVSKFNPIMEFCPICSNKL